MKKIAEFKQKSIYCLHLLDRILERQGLEIPQRPDEAAAQKKRLERKLLQKSREFLRTKQAALKRLEIYPEEQ